MTHFSTWGTLRRASMLNVAPQDGAGGWWVVVVERGWGGRGGDGQPTREAPSSKRGVPAASSNTLFLALLFLFFYVRRFLLRRITRHSVLRICPDSFFFSFTSLTRYSWCLPRLRGDGGGVGMCVGGREREEVSADLARVLSPRCSRRSVPRFF